MKQNITILILTLSITLGIAGCDPYNNQGNPPTQNPTIIADSIYVIADIRKHGDYYNSGHQVFAVDLLSQGLTYDSTMHITGTGYNLFLSDIFVKCVSRPAGHYEMDSVAKDMTFLKGMDFEGNITGTYLLQIQEDKIQTITLFTAGSMEIAYDGEGMKMEMVLYTADSAKYKAKWNSGI